MCLVGFGGFGIFGGDAGFSLGVGLTAVGFGLPPPAGAITRGPLSQLPELVG